MQMNPEGFVLFCLFVCLFLLKQSLMTAVGEVSTPASSPSSLPCICPSPSLLARTWLSSPGSLCGSCPALACDTHLAGVDALVDGCTIRLSLLGLFSVDDIFLPAHLGHFA